MGSKPAPSSKIALVLDFATIRAPVDRRVPSENDEMTAMGHSRRCRTLKMSGPAKTGQEVQIRLVSRGADGDHGTSLLKQRHRLVCQHAAGDRDSSKWRLGRDLGARQHDLIDLRRELRHRRRKHQPLDPAPQDGAHAHRTRFARRVERAAAQGGWAVLRSIRRCLRHVRFASKSDR